MTRKHLLAGAVAALGCATPALPDTLPVIADSQVNLTSVALKGGALTTTAVKNSLPGAAYRTFAKFDLRALPPGLPVTKATLRLWPNLVTTAGTVDLSAVLGPWDEATLAAITAPALSQPLIDFSVEKADLKTYINVDVTELVKDWVDGDLQNHGLALVGQPGSIVNAKFDSKENATTSHPMELEVILGLPPGSGDITSIVPGFGLTGGGNLGDVTLGVNPNQVQQRVSAQCPLGASIRGIDANGNVICQNGDITGVTAGFGLTGGGFLGDVLLNIDPTVVQRRVATACPTGQSIRSIDGAGAVSCEPDGAIVEVRGFGTSGVFSLGPSPVFLCRTTPYTAQTGDRALVSVTASCGILPGQAFTTQVGWSTGTDTASGIAVPETNTGTLNGYLNSSQFANFALTAGSTYTFTTAVRNFSGATANATCYCTTMAQIWR